MRVTRVAADHVRSLNGVSLDLDSGVTALVGQNGAGKTNLIEAIYFGLTGRSFRTAERRDLIPFGESYARCRVVVEDGEGIKHEFMSSTSRSEGSRFTMDGAAIERSQAAAYRPAVTVFSPDRLELVKGPPAVRRAHLDAYVAARWPSRGESRTKFGRVLAQRNALLARIQAGEANVHQLGVWDRQVAETGARLCAVRTEAVAELSGYFRTVSAELGLEGDCQLEYRPGACADIEEIVEGLAQRLDYDVRLGRTSWGPHHDELRLEFNGRQLRRFGSQGQQRTGLLSLLFAERTALLEARSEAPLMLLDDVMSELDSERRERLVTRLSQGGQSLITAAETDLIPKSGEISEVAFDSVPGVTVATGGTGEAADA